MIGGVFMFQSNKRLKIWETALLCAFALTLLAACWAQGRQHALADGLIRLHVIAADDSESEQALKLRVRDAVLACLEPKLEGMSDAAEAAETVRASLGEIRLAAESVSEGRSVAVALGQERYPLRQYEGFALPAGEYLALRVTLGAGAGHNWWCVLFPPLCTEAVTSDRAVETLSSDDMQLITENGTGYILRFRVLELWDAVKTYLTAPPS